MARIYNVPITCMTIWSTRLKAAYEYNTVLLHLLSIGASMLQQNTYVITSNAYGGALLAIDDMCGTAAPFHSDQNLCCARSGARQIRRTVRSRFSFPFPFRFWFLLVNDRDRPRHLLLCVSPEAPWTVFGTG